MKPWILFPAAVLLCYALTACAVRPMPAPAEVPGDSADAGAELEAPAQQVEKKEPEPPAQPDGQNTAPVNTIPQTGMTEAVPAEYTRACDRPGTVERLDYASAHYAGDGSAVTKTAYVYLPYGYDEADTETRYDIVYLMHGWGGHAGEYFDFSAQKNMFDNLIAHGDVPPLIIL